MRPANGLMSSGERICRMNIESIYVLGATSFGKHFETWAEENKIPTSRIEETKEALEDTIGGLVIFHENHNISKEAEELQKMFDSNNKPYHKVDINGTLVATLSNFRMWLERNDCKNLVISGEEELAKSERLHRFISELTV